MAKVTINKESNYTVIDNGIFSDRNLSLKARGLLVTMLSLPEEWDYSIDGLTVILKEGKDCIRAALNELEKYGYLVRNRVRNDKGQLIDNEYIIYEKPQNIEEKPDSEPKSENPMLDNPTQLNKKELNKKDNNYSPTSSGVCDIVEKAKSITENQEIINAVEYYLSKYKEEMGVNHPDVTYSALNRVIDNILTVLEDIIDDTTLEDVLTKMIDRHFDTNYGQPIDYKIQHFGTEGIIEMQARNCGLIVGYRG